MFVAVEFQNMRSRCLPELEKLLENLSIPIPDWSGDEYRIYEELDEELMKKICALMKSSSVIEGYTKLLKLGGVAYDYSETDNELLNKIVSNGDKILDAVRKANDKYNTWQAEWGNVSSAPERVETLNVTAVNAEPFNIEGFICNLKAAKSLLNRTSSNSSEIINARSLIAESLNTSERLNNLLKFTGSRVRIEDVNDFVQRISAKLRDGEEHTICLTIKKSIEEHEKKIPPAPPEPPFSVREVEDALKILIQVNDIIKKI